MSRRLGRGTHRAYIYNRGGGTRVLTVDGITGLEWGRTRNAVSRAQVTVATAQATRGCRSALVDVHPWAHELVVFRDDQRVWEGPIRTKADTGDTIVLSASDVWGWAERTPIDLDRVTTVDHAVSTEGSTAVTRAMNAAGDPNVLAFLDVRTHASEAVLQRDVKARSGYYSDDLAALTDQGLNYTVVGRSIVLWPVEYILGRAPGLLLERDTGVTPTVTEDGDALATYLYATGDGEDTYALHTGDTSYYGPVGLISSAPAVRQAATLARVAARRQKRAYPAPLRIDVPGDAPLSPDAPLLISDLVPGVLVPVTSNALSRPLEATMILDTVKVTVGPGGEQVAVTFGQPGVYT